MKHGIRIFIPRVVPVAEFIDVVVQVLPAYAVKLPMHPSLDQRPEALDRVGMDVSTHVPGLVPSYSMG